MKVSQAQLMEIVRKLVKEALNEAGPLGYLSKTRRPDAKTGWDPSAQKQWVAANSDPTSPGRPLPTQSSTPSQQQSGGVADSGGEKTVAGVPSAKSGGMKSSPASSPSSSSSSTPTQQPTSKPAQQSGSLADLSSMLQNASQDQIAQIMSILKGN